MRVVFMGTPDFAVPFFDGLLDAGHEVLAAVTQPDRPRGRGMRVEPPPVKVRAEARGIPVLQPHNTRDPEFLAAMRRLEPEAIVVVAYGRIVPRELLELPRYGCINVHPSLLPRHRGASPIPAAILAGDEVTGISTMYLSEGLDEGDVILQARLSIRPDDTAASLTERLIAVGVPLLLQTLELVEAGRAPRIPQDAALATYAPRLEKGDGAIDWRMGAVHLDRLIRAFYPAPGAYTRFQGRRVRVLRAAVETATGSGEPGVIVAAGPEGISVQTGEGVLRLREVQPENSRPMQAVDFINGYRVRPGMRFELPAPEEDRGQAP